MSADAERDAADTAKWAARWRELEREAIEIASEMADPEAKRHMLFVAENYRLLAERIELRGELLAAVDDVKRVPDKRQRCR
jgi:anion-transporting  ArsA/GET3 family ATPase